MSFPLCRLLGLLTTLTASFACHGWSCGELGGGALPAYRASIVMDQRLPKVLAALADTDHIQEWLVLANHAEILKKTAASAVVHLFLGGPPGTLTPMQDAVLETRLATESSWQALRLCMTPLPSPPAPELTRIDELAVTWTLTALPLGQTRVELDMEIRPPFALPVFVAPLARLAPERSLRNLDSYLKHSPQDQNPITFLRRRSDEGFWEPLLKSRSPEGEND